MKIIISVVVLPSQWLDGCWFYRPEETFHLAVKKFYKKVSWPDFTFMYIMVCSVIALGKHTWVTRHILFGHFRVADGQSN